jgi:uncharacterized membrane protein YphA (DoxX/SURF4 family)
MNIYKKSIAIIVALGAFFAPILASAHEVYVLTGSEIANDISSPPFNMLDVVKNDLRQFIFWAFIAFVVVSTIFFVSIFRPIERVLDPFFERAKKYAPMICRITVGLGLLAGAYYQASYGPELPYSAAYGSHAPFITLLTVLIGVLFLAGKYVRQAAIVALALFAFAIWQNGIYMLTYTNYFGEFLILLILALHIPGQESNATDFWGKIERAVSPYAFLIVRVAFGVSLLYASIYAKILHNNLALQVATLPLAGHMYGVAHYLGFEPHFLVLGAAIIEILIALFFIFGIEIRWTCIFLEFWLALSLWYFGEVVWPHLILIGIPIALFLWGYDQYSLEGRFFKRDNLEPVL